MQASIRELKDHLSEYLHQVQGGAEILITSHNKPLAKIVPVSFSKSSIEDLKKDTHVHWNGKKPRLRPLKVKLKSGKKISDIVLEDRK